ncbi:hypothetical protein [Inquilinus limosus]|uniref:Uncharacterized protein n=1 Tax=Inquilinus limosus TaxID=171674 RepID=A0A211ZEQ2_9PROT|nr:hypothetical protein [Inquilinus limosus]OWJ63607.1 hypothetical protein BWR60_28620 [Inquilinus limosus]
MSALIRIDFAGGTATSGNVSVVLTDCTVAPSAQNGVVVAMASALTNISVLSDQVTIATTTGAQFNGSVAIAISWVEGGQPSVALDNLQIGGGNPATVTWSTSGGPETQILASGDPLALVGIVND